MEKNEEKESKSDINTIGKIDKGGKKTMTRRIIETLFEFNRPMEVQEIVRDTRYTEKQVWEVLRFLSALKMVTKKYENLDAKGYKSPPRRILKVNLTQSQFKRARRFLRR